MNIKKISILTGICFTLSLQAARLRFILINNTGANLFACLRTHDCNPLNEPEMSPGDVSNIFTENFKAGVTRFFFKLQTNTEFRAYEIVYNSQKKLLQLQRNGITFDETPYDANYAQYPPVIYIGAGLDEVHKNNYGRIDVHFDNDAIYNNQKVTGMNTPNITGYRPSLYLGDRGPIPLRRDKNHFCKKHTPCRDNLSSLSAYVGTCTRPTPHDNLNPFCSRNKVNWRSKRFENCTKRCT